MRKISKSYKLVSDVVELHQTIKALGGISEGQVIEALTYMLVDQSGIQGILDYITTLEFKDGRKKDQD